MTSRDDSNIAVLDDFRKSMGRGLKSSGGGGTFDGMEGRVARLEEQFGRIDGKLDAIAKDIVASRVEQAEIKGKISNMPSTWQLIGLIVGLLGLAFVILRLASGAP